MEYTATLTAYTYMITTVIIIAAKSTASGATATITSMATTAITVRKKQGT